MNAALALTVILSLAGPLTVGLLRVVRSDGYGRHPAPRSWPDERETRPQTFARLAR